MLHDDTQYLGWPQHRPKPSLPFFRLGSKGFDVAAGFWLMLLFHIPYLLALNLKYNIDQCPALLKAGLRRVECYTARLKPPGLQRTLLLL